ncbi:unnamed protein product [Rotaria magnacalcarata]|uniref:Methyltransferase domain-containing protein n=1 Tax=Rotaria magnacalcarata TaxID=392030 RepID=A0A820G9B4_9BILA|nr:unnamed protein product [Rotaria magnacalcarata]CAF4273130.1 unnamed protein product [Rotaria magnacalcarata]
MQETDYIRGGLAEKLLAQGISIQEKTTILIQDKNFVIYPNVFNPIVYSATLCFTYSFLNLIQRLKPQHLLELGTGAGYNAVLTALNGASYVMCTDVSQVAVNNAQENIDNHQLGNRVTVVCSDVFDSLPSEWRNKFDLIFWNFPFNHINKSVSELTDLERCVFDRKHEAIDICSRDIREFLVPYSGRAFFDFSAAIASIEQFSNIAAKHNWKLQLVNEDKTTVDEESDFEELDLPIEDLPRSCRPTCFDKKKLKRLHNAATNHVGVSQTKLAREFGVAQSIIHYRLKKMGLKYYNRYKAPRYSQEQLQQAPKKCGKLRRQIITSNTLIIVDDEKYFSFSNDEMLQNVGFFSLDKEHALDNLALSVKGISKPFIGTTTGPAITANVYINSCLNKLLAFIEEHHGDDKYIFRRDLASSHYAKKTTTWLRQYKIKIVPKQVNPPNVPKARPI